MERLERTPESAYNQQLSRAGTFLKAGTRRYGRYVWKLAWVHSLGQLENAGNGSAYSFRPTIFNCSSN